MNTIRFKYCYSSSIAGEVIDKQWWNDGQEKLYTCQETPILSTYNKFPKRKRTTKHSLLLTRNATPYIFIPEENSIYSNVVQKVEISTDKFSRRFIRYSLQDRVDGMKVDGDIIPSWNMNIWNNLKICNFSLKKQDEIANWLDKKCFAIDKIIKNEENEISFLNSYKFSLITKIVTEGLDNVEKINTNNKWFRKIPKNWQIKKIKNVLSINNGIRVGPFGSSLSGKVLYDKSDVRIYGQWNVIAKDFTIDRNFVTFSSYKTLKQYEVMPGDILLSMMGTIGRCLTVPDSNEKGIMDSHIIKIRLNDLINPRYFEYFYDKTFSNCCIKQLDYLKKGSIMDGLNSSILKEIFICVPPFTEQVKIVNYLDEKCSKINDLIRIKEKKIETLKSYKKSLIYECVTGKKEIQYAD